jgi:hypothetical protein
MNFILRRHINKTVIVNTNIMTHTHTITRTYTNTHKERSRNARVLTHRHLKFTRINTHLLWHINVMHAFVGFIGQGMAGRVGFCR